MSERAAKTTRLPGHALVGGGAHTASARDEEDRAMCTCGAVSSRGSGVSAVRRWHRRHKQWEAEALAAASESPAASEGAPS